MATTAAPPSITIKKEKSSRDINLDILRILAFLCVPCAHFFLYTGFYEMNVTHPLMIILVYIRDLFLICVPTFLMLTGYLQCEKSFEPNKKYYSRISKFLIPFLIISLLILVFNGVMDKKIPSVLQVIKGFTTYTGYSWYVEMYIGLFLLIPFLNKIYSTLTTKKQEQILLGILIALTLLPTVINAYDFSTSNWISAQKSSNGYTKLIPDFFTSLYPITFYFTGAYLKRHKDEIKLSTAKRFLIFVCVFIICGTYNVIRTYGTVPTVYLWLHRNSILSYATAVTLFIFIISIDMSKVGAKPARFIAKISDLTFSAYLCSYLCDKTVYKYLCRYAPTFSKRLLTYPLAVGIVIIGSIIIAFFVDLITKKLSEFVDKRVNKTGKSANP